MLFAKSARGLKCLRVHGTVDDEIWFQVIVTGPGEAVRMLVHSGDDAM